MDNNETRIDYIAMPRGLPCDNILSKVATEIDLSVHRTDHRASTFAFELYVQKKTSKPNHQRRRGPDVQDLANKLQDNTIFQTLHYAVSAPPWALNPHLSGTSPKPPGR